MTPLLGPPQSTGGVSFNPNGLQPMPNPDHRAREDMRAWLESQDVYCAQPAFLDALIRLFQSIEKGGEEDEH